MIANPKEFSEPQTKKAVLVISSQVMCVAGSVDALRYLYLERNGFPVWFLPTVLLPWHPGHGPATKNTMLHQRNFFKNGRRITKVQSGLAK